MGGRTTGCGVCVQQRCVQVSEHSLYAVLYTLIIPMPILTHGLFHSSHLAWLHPVHVSLHDANRTTNVCMHMCLCVCVSHAVWVPLVSGVWLHQAVGVYRVTAIQRLVGLSLFRCALCHSSVSMRQQCLQW